MRRAARGFSAVVALSIFVACSGDDTGADDSNTGFGGAGGFYSGADGFPAVNGGAPAPGPGCGNGVVNPGEACDGAPPGARTCATETMGTRASGVLRCTACTIDASGCVAASTPGSGGSTPGGTGGMPDGAGGAPIQSGGTPGAGGTLQSGGAPGAGGDPTAGNGETGRMVGMTAATNAVRATVGVPPVTWSPDIAAVAQAYADQLATQGCPLVHSGRAGYGENLSWFSGQPGSAQMSVDLWASELSCYTFGPFMRGDQCTSACDQYGGCGHYTQLVWRNTTQIGCGMATCPGEEIWVCNYQPPGNYIGQNPY